MSRNDNYLGLELPGVGSILVVMASQGVFYFVVLFILESGIGKRARRLMARMRHRDPSVSPDPLRPQPSQLGFPDEDVDVQNEREFILGTPLDALFSSDAIVVYGLAKSFAGFRAVNKLTFRVPRVRTPCTRAAVGIGFQMGIGTWDPIPTVALP